MKYYIQISFILCAALCTSSLATAQSVNESTADSSAIIEAKPSVQVAFRKVAESDILGSVSVVDMTDLIEKNYATYSLDNMQGLVGGWTGNSIWGMNDYLVLVDGVPRDANNVMPTEIEQVTFLKS